MSNSDDGQRAEDGLRRERLQGEKSEAEGRLTSGVVHEMNNALNAIIAFADLALQGAGDDERLRDDIGEIRLAAMRAADITRRLLVLSRRQSPKPRTVALNRIVGHAEDLFRRLVGEPAALEVRLAPDAGHVCTAPAHIEEVVVNVALNARDAMLAGGKLLIETTAVRLEAGQPAVFGVIPPGDYAVVRISDAGRETSSEVLIRAFEPFFAAARGRSLGLPALHGIIRQSGGWVRVQSEIGKGSCVEVYLARVADESVSEAEAVEAVQETVLLVDDEDLVRRGMARILSREGYRVLSAPSGAEALNLCRGLGAPLDLLVTDLSMPGMDGRELAARIAEDIPGIKILFITGYSDQAVLCEAALDRGRAIMLKPFSAEELLAKTREILDH